MINWRVKGIWCIWGEQEPNSAELWYEHNVVLLWIYIQLASRNLTALASVSAMQTGRHVLIDHTAGGGRAGIIVACGIDGYIQVAPSRSAAHLAKHPRNGCSFGISVVFLWALMWFISVRICDNVIFASVCSRAGACDWKQAPMDSSEKVHLRYSAINAE